MPDKPVLDARFRSGSNRIVMCMRSDDKGDWKRILIDISRAQAQSAQVTWSARMKPAEPAAH